MSRPSVDFSQTKTAQRNRATKAKTLAEAARAAGLTVPELKIEWSTASDERRREEVRKAAGFKTRPSDQTWALALEALAALAFDATGGVTCRKCGAPVRRVKALSGAMIEIDPYAHQAGTVWPRNDNGQVIAVVIAGHDTPPQDTPLFRQHAQTCERGPLAAARRIREAPKCRACGQALDAALAYSCAEYTIHPCCEFEEEVMTRWKSTKKKQ